MATKRSEPGAQLAAKGPHDETATPDWDAVEALLSRLASSRAVFPTSSSSSNWISSYEPGRRIMLESGDSSRWIRVEHLQSCWTTFERLRRIRKDDVMDPGRASAFVMALFAQLPGVRRVERDEPYLVLPRRKQLVRTPGTNGFARTSTR